MSVPTPIPFPLSSFPGSDPQESQGRLINCYAEPLGETGSKAFKWVRSAGLSLLAATTESGYRGGLVVNNLSYECWEDNASTVSAAGAVTSLGNFPGSKKVSIARNQGFPTADVVAVDLDNGAYVLGSASVVAASVAGTFSGSTLNVGDVIVLDVLNPFISSFPVSLSHTVGVSDTLSSVATAFASLIGANSALAAAHVSASSSGHVLTVQQQGALGNSTTIISATTAVGSPDNGTTVSANFSGTGNETVTLSNSGLLVSSGGAATASISATVGGTMFISGDVVGLNFANAGVAGFPVQISYAVGGSDTSTTIAAALAAGINASTMLASAEITARSSANVVTITQTIGTANVAFSPASGGMSGGQGTPNIFSGIPTAYSAAGVLPAPNSVCFQDGYFFFTTGDGHIYATGINSLSMNALTEVKVQAKADVDLLRGVAFSGVLLAFTTGSCEVWQDAANPAPNFPYSRTAVLEVGLVQPTAIAGWETGFSELLWVAQDFGVHWMTASQTGQIKVSPPDLERLIESEVRAGNTLEAGCYVTSGKKFWTLSSPNWSWEFNLQTGKWNERQSLNGFGVFGRWRGIGGHPAFGKWLAGDELSGNLLFPDDSNPTESGDVLLWQIDSGPVKKFPAQQRIVRADFDFVVGVGRAVGNITVAVTNAILGAGGAVRLSVQSTDGMNDGDWVVVSGVVGTIEANGTWQIAVSDETDIRLRNTTFANAYVSGGTVRDITSPSNEQNPSVAIFMSKDGGVFWGNPLIRPLGAQQKVQRTRVTVSNMGLSGPMGVRWRLQISDPVYASLMGGMMSNTLRIPGP